MKAIYGIINKLTGDQYVGSAINFYKRKYQHVYRLNLKFHPNQHLQAAWNKYGEQMFEFIILEKIENKEDLIIREQWWIDNSNSKYNICKIAGSTLGRKWSEQARKNRMAVWIPFTEEQQNNRLSKIRKIVIQYTKDDIFIKEWPSLAEAARALNINKSHISNCCNGRSKTCGGFKWKLKN